MEKQEKWIELRPDRTLLNSNFDGYKLSLAEIPAITKILQVPVDRIFPDLDEYSLLHAKLYALHNHLVADENESVFFIDKTRTVQKAEMDPLTNNLTITAQWQIPSHREKIIGDYNTSMRFASEKYLAVADGAGFIFILERTSTRWEEIFSGNVIGPDQHFVISDILYNATNNQIHLLLLNIKLGDSNEKHASILHWIVIAKTETEAWNQISLKQLTVTGFIQYSHLEPKGDAVYVVSDNGCKFTLDSEKEISSETGDADKAEHKYTWTQSEEDITIKFPLPENGTKTSISVKTDNCTIQVKYEENVLLSGSLYQRVDPDLTSWTVESNTLNIALQKVETGSIWPEVVQGDNLGVYLIDPDLLAKINQSMAPLTSETEAMPPTGTTFNSQQVEDCDFESDKMNMFERLCPNTHKVTHKVSLGSHNVLLTVKLNNNLPPAIGIRYDVDTCIWQPKCDADGFQMEHKGTLLALGYIQASKQQMKFFVCSPNLNHSVICEAGKHIFIYCQEKSIQSSAELRNRTTGQRIRNLAQQQVFTLPTDDEILGIFLSNSHLYILGEDFLTVLNL